MNMGLGFSEIVLIVALVLIFFGSKELPRFIREIAAFMAKARRYSDKVRRELDDLTRPAIAPNEPPVNEVAQRKQSLRTRYSATRKVLSPEERKQKSAAIMQHLFATLQYKKARAIMIYASVGAEVQTHAAITQMLNDGKRVILPYCRTMSSDLGLGEIQDLERDCEAGEFHICEPVRERRDNFFKSDLQLIVCPGVAFDPWGARLGRGKRYYDVFLAEVKSRIPIFGIAYQCQITSEALPFDYHDIGMDQVITEDGFLIKAEEPAARADVPVPAIGEAAPAPENPGAPQ